MTRPRSARAVRAALNVPPAEPALGPCPLRWALGKALPNPQVMPSLPRLVPVTGKVVETVVSETAAPQSRRRKP